jgi:hypothetical protein
MQKAFAKESLGESLVLADFCRIFDAKPDEFSQRCVREISSRDFCFDFLEGRDHELALLSALKAVDSGAQTVSGPEKKAQWEKGWSENLRSFIESGDMRSLVPKYVKRSRPMRLEGRYIRPNSPEFEDSFLAVFHTYVFEKYLEDSVEIFEFGSGTGLNLLELTELFPTKILHGLDWAESSKSILDQISPRYGGRIQGHIFDMFSPDAKLQFPPGSAVLTAGALEQLGSKFESFLEFILQRRPKICVHLEPIYELYDENSLFDYVAARFSISRNWLRGFLPRLRELEKQGTIEILKVKRTIGSFYHDGYSIVVWRPTCP